MATEPQCPGRIATDISGYPICQDDQGTPLQWAEVDPTPPFETDDIDPLEAGQYFAAGFVLVGTAFAIGKAIGLLLSGINNLGKM